MGWNTETDQSPDQRGRHIGPPKSSASCNGVVHVSCDYGVMPSMCMCTQYVYIYIRRTLRAVSRVRRDSLRCNAVHVGCSPGSSVPGGEPGSMRAQHDILSTVVSYSVHRTGCSGRDALAGWISQFAVLHWRGWSDGSIAILAILAILAMALQFPDFSLAALGFLTLYRPLLQATTLLVLSNCRVPWASVSFLRFFQLVLLHGASCSLLFVAFRRLCSSQLFAVCRCFAGFFLQRTKQRLAPVWLINPVPGSSG